MLQPRGSARQRDRGRDLAGEGSWALGDENRAWISVLLAAPAWFPYLQGHCEKNCIKVAWGGLVSLRGGDSQSPFGE